jgi:hypothetical protein
MANDGDRDERGGLDRAPGTGPEATPGAAHPHPDDSVLLAAVGRVLEAIDPVPAGVLDAARAAFGWREVDAELAALIADSAEASAGVRGDDDGGPDAPGAATAGTSAARVVTFDGPTGGVEVELSRGRAGSVRLLGQVVPAGRAEVEVRTPAGPGPRTETDDVGVFVVDGVPRGPVSLRVSRPDAPPMVTAWTRI